jgi:predicted small metal-binding protein
MAWVINCDCGYVAKAETQEDLLQDAEQHIQNDHPDMVGKVSREDLLAQAKEQ